MSTTPCLLQNVKGGSWVRRCRTRQTWILHKETGSLPGLLHWAPQQWWVQGLNPKFLISSLLNHFYFLDTCSHGTNQSRVCFKNTEFLLIDSLGRDGGMIVGASDYSCSWDCCLEGTVNLRSSWKRKLECCWHGIYLPSLGTAAVLQIMLPFPSFSYLLLIFHMLKGVLSHPCGMDHAEVFSASLQSQLSQTAFMLKSHKLTQMTLYWSWWRAVALKSASCKNYFEWLSSILLWKAHRRN